VNRPQEAFFARAAWMAVQIFAGVAGMSMARMP
jgi:hypothetical protein